jgi:hypothetical protein
MYGGIFGPSVIAALKKLADVKTIIANTLVELDSPVHAGASVDNATTQGIFFDTTQTNTWCAFASLICPSLEIYPHLCRNLARLNTGTEMVDEVIDDRDKSGALRDQNTRNWPFRNFRNAGKNVNVSFTEVDALTIVLNKTRYILSTPGSVTTTILQGG